MTKSCQVKACFHVRVTVEVFRSPSTSKFDCSQLAHIIRSHDVSSAVTVRVRQTTVTRHACVETRTNW